MPSVGLRSRLVTVAQRPPAYVHLAFLDGLEYWSRQSITTEQTRARANAISGTGLVAFHILDTSMALKKKSYRRILVTVGVRRQRLGVAI
jgi:hypothetical protein